jgi:hypothetical protein
MSVEWLERVYWQLERFMVPGLKDAQDSYAETAPSRTCVASWRWTWYTSTGAACSRI